MTALVGKHLASGDIYLQRWDFDGQVDYWTPDPAQAHLFDGAATADAIARQLGIAGFEVYSFGPPWEHQL